MLFMWRQAIVGSLLGAIASTFLYLAITQSGSLNITVALIVIGVLALICGIGVFLFGDSFNEWLGNRMWW